MKKLAIYTMTLGVLAGSFSASANDLGYMINPTEDDHKVPVAVTQTGVENDGKLKKFDIAKEFNDSALGDIAPAAGGVDSKPSYDHLLGH